MKKATYLLIAIGCILVLITVLCKEMHWPGRHALLVAAICVLLLAMVLYIVNIFRSKQAT
ncbi:MAG TPA: hypothetical protein VN721_00525 [Flavipsychrobacter sp.]|nr:hypothetical protein [Flavipsychrobacter sp.]